MSTPTVLLFTPPYFRGTITNTPSGTAYSVKPGETVAAPQGDEDFLRGLGFSPAAPSPLTVSDETTTITSVSGVLFTSGATITNLGGGAVGVAISGGGSGGSYAAGNGISFNGTSPTTIIVSGTLVQPTEAGTTNGLGIELIGASTTGTGTPGAISIYGGSSQGGNAAPAYIGAGSSYVPGGQGNGASVFLKAATSNGVTAAGGGFYVQGGPGYNADGGFAIIKGGTKYGTIGNGGGISLDVGVPHGSGDNGLLLISNIGTVDPHVLNAKWQTSVAGVGFVGIYSKG